MTLWKKATPFLLAITLGACSEPSPTPDAGGAATGTSNLATPGGNAASGANSSAKPEAPPTKPAVTIPEGDELEISLSTSLSSATNKPGDEFTGSLRSPVMLNGVTVLDKGTRVQGKVLDAQDSGRVKGLASMRLTLTGVMSGEKMIPVSTRPFAVEAEDTKKRDAGIIGGAAGIGAAVGAIAGGAKGAVTGAVVGGGAGTGAVLGTKGKEVEFPAESRLIFKLDKALTLNP